MIYIYFFPFVILFHIARLGIRFALKLNTFINGNEGCPETDVPYYANLSSPVLVLANPKPAEDAQSAVATAETKPAVRRVGDFLRRPFRRYTLLWCLLLLLTTHTLFIYLALGIIAFRLVDLVVGVFALSFTSNGWFTKISEYINRFIDENMSKISTAKDAAVSREAKNAWIALRGFLKGVAYFRDRRKVAQWTVFLGCVAFVIIYVYLALLFSFTYYGIARLQNIVWTGRRR